VENKIEKKEKEIESGREPFSKRSGIVPEWAVSEMTAEGSACALTANDVAQFRQMDNFLRQPVQPTDAVPLK
jgi:hypothetical protein